MQGRGFWYNSIRTKVSNIMIKIILGDISCYSLEREKSVYENLTCAGETLKVSRNTDRKYL